MQDMNSGFRIDSEDEEGAAMQTGDDAAALQLATTAGDAYQEQSATMASWAAETWGERTRT